MDEKLLTIQQAAKFLNVNAGTLRRWAQDKKVRGIKVGTRGDWRFTKGNLQKIVKENRKAELNSKIYRYIQKFLLVNANRIQKLATEHHKKFLGGRLFRTEFIDKYQKNHITIVQELARNLNEDTRKGTVVFKKLGELVAKDAVEDDLTIEESVDGIIFLKQAIWELLDKEGVLRELTAKDFYQVNQAIGIYCDVISSRIAFVYHHVYEKKVAKDIAEQKKSEEITSFFAAIVQSSEDAIISKNLEGIITSWNKAAEELFGYTAKEAIGKHITLIIPKELYNEEAHIITKIKKGIRIEHFETMRQRKNGSKVTISLSISPIKDRHEGIIGAAKVARDITERKQMEQNLQFLSESSKILSSSLDYNATLQSVAKAAVPHIGDWCGVDILEEDGSLQQVAVAHKDPKKVKWARAYRKAHPRKLLDATGVALAINTQKSLLYPLITDEMLVASAKNKKELELARKLNIVSVMIVPIITHKKAIGAISFVTSDTKRQYTNSDLTMAEELASRAALAIENARLYQQAQKELAQRKMLEKQKDEFIGVASHELKTPVTSIKSFAQVLRLKFTREGNQKAADLLGKMDAQVDKLTSLIGDLLDVTKIEAGRMQFSQEYFSFDELVGELVEELQRTTEKHTLIEKGKTGKTVFGDRERVGQVITNLVSNAIKYSPHTKEINIHSCIEGKYIKLCVQDFGIGIAKDKQDKVFERFFRASGPGQETYPGLGLGLYVSSEIIKRMDGRLWVESIEGKGSTFCFVIPLKGKRNSKDNQLFAEEAIQHE